MKYIKEIGIISIVAIALFILPIVLAQQPNEYRAYVYSERVSPYLDHGASTVPLVVEITYVPIYPSTTYPLTAGYTIVQVDLNSPTSIDTVISNSVKEDGLRQGFDVTRVYLPSYTMKVV